MVIVPYIRHNAVHTAQCRMPYAVWNMPYGSTHPLYYQNILLLGAVNVSEMLLKWFSNDFFSWCFFPKHFGNVIKNDTEIVLKTLTKNYIFISVYILSANVWIITSDDIVFRMFVKHCANVIKMCRWNCL